MAPVPGTTTVSVQIDALTLLEARAVAKRDALRFGEVVSEALARWLSTRPKLANPKLTDADLASAWFAERVEVRGSARTPLAELRGDYIAWAKDTGQTAVLSPRELSRQIRILVAKATGRPPRSVYLKTSDRSKRVDGVMFVLGVELRPWRERLVEVLSADDL